VIEDFTVVTVSYERKVFLKRYLEMAGRNGFYTILVDGSEHAYSETIPDNVDYFHMPGETARKRLAFAIEKVSTSYLVLLADDDFLLPSVLLKGAKFLAEHPDYSSVQGRVLTFNERYEKSDVLYKSYKGFDSPAILNSSCANVRLEAHMRNYIFTFYSLQKTEVWKRFFTDIYAGLKDHLVFAQNNPAIFELAQSIHCVLSGKNKMFDDVYLVRESIPRPTSEVKKDHFYFNETDEFDDFLLDFSKILNRIFSRLSVDYQGLLRRAFSIFAEQRRRKTKGGNFTTRGSFPNLIKVFQNGQQELLSIHNSVLSHRKSALDMLNEAGLISVSYWYDESWKQRVAAKFSQITSQQSNYIVYGAGEHTRELASSVGLGKGIKCIADSNADNWGKNMMGVVCINPREIFKYSSHVIISSQNFEDEILLSLKKMYGDSINVFTLYE